MKLATMAVFGVGYVLGSKAGRERYAQIKVAAQKTSRRLDAYGSGGGQSSRRSSGPTNAGSAARSRR